MIPIDVTDAGQPLVAMVDAASPAPAAMPVAGGAPTVVWCALDGTLLASNDKQIAARAPDGTLHRHTLAQSATLHTSPDLSGVIVDEGGGVKLLATPSLVVL